MPWVAFVFLMGHMSANHIIRQFYVSRPDLVDITGAFSGLGLVSEMCSLRNQEHRWS